MSQVRDAVEHRAVWRDVADRDHRLERVESVEALFEFLLGVLAGRVEGRAIRIAEADHVEAGDFHPAAVKVVEPETFAKVRGLLRGFVIARNDIDAVAALFQNLSHRI